MWVAGLRGGATLVLLAVLSGILPIEEDTDLHARWMFALIIELYNLSMEKFTGNEKSATRSAMMRVFALT